MQRTAVVTGATSGLGREAAKALSAAGWRVLVVGRDSGRGAELAAAGTEFVAGDLSSVAGARALGAELARRAPQLDLLVNNAGGVFAKKELNQDGLERTFALNVVAPYVLTDALLGPLAAAQGRVVNLVTGIPRGGKVTPAKRQSALEQLVGRATTAGLSGYTRAKLALLALSGEQQRRYGARGVTVVSLHPGIIPGTRFGQELPKIMLAIGSFIARLFRLASTPAEAAARYVLVGTGKVEPGGFYAQGKLAPAPHLAEDATFAADLWTRLETFAKA